MPGISHHDIHRLSAEDVLKRLETTDGGLSSDDVQWRLAQYGPNVAVLLFSTAERKGLGTKFLGTIAIIFGAAHTRHQILVVPDDIRDLLRNRHRLHQPEEDDFGIRTMEDRSQDTFLGILPRMTESDVKC